MKRYITILKKYVIIVVVGIMIILIIGAIQQNDEKTNIKDNTNNSTSQQNDTVQSEQYKFNMGVYMKDKVRVSYPQLTGLADIAKQDKINNMLREKAISVHISNQADADQSYEAESNYSIKCDRDNVISILYTSYANFENSAHPFNIAYAITIDVKNAKELKLTDFVSKVDDTFITKLKSGKYIGEFAEEEQKNIYGVAFDGYESNQDIINVVLNQRGYEESCFYVTPNTIGISLPVPHFAGDHVEYEIERI